MKGQHKGMLGHCMGSSLDRCHGGRLDAHVAVQNLMIMLVLIIYLVLISTRSSIISSFHPPEKSILLGSWHFSR